MIAGVEDPSGDVSPGIALAQQLHGPPDEPVVRLAEAEPVGGHLAGQFIEGFLIAELRRPELLRQPLAKGRHVPADPAMPVAFAPPVRLGPTAYTGCATFRLGWNRASGVRRAAQPCTQSLAQPAGHGVHRRVPSVQ
eukprot:scaffold11370_cov129-Isochrysis_galbana.AAC.11